jgi:hypothetical protein
VCECVCVCVCGVSGLRSTAKCVISECAYLGTYEAHALKRQLDATSAACNCAYLGAYESARAVKEAVARALASCTSSVKCG